MAEYMAIEAEECPHGDTVPGLVALEEAARVGTHWSPEAFEHLRECTYAYPGHWVRVRVVDPLVPVSDVVLARAHLPGQSVEAVVEALRAVNRDG